MKKEEKALRFDYLLHLLYLGIKPKHAVKMAKQADPDGTLTERCSSAYTAVSGFRVFCETTEGADYWSAVLSSHLQAT